MISDGFGETFNQFLCVMLFQVKRSKLHEQIIDLDVTWKKIVKFLNEKLEKSEMQSVNEDLKDILQAAKQIGIVFISFCFIEPLSFKNRFLLNCIPYCERLKFPDKYL